MTIADEHHDLYDELAGPEPDYDQAPAEPGDLEGVNRALRRLARHRVARDAVVSVHEAEIDRIRSRLDERLEVIDAAIQWETDGLEMFHRARLADDPKAKTLHLPSGTLKARARQPRWDIDEPTFVPWAAEHAPDLLRIAAPSPDRAEVKKALAVEDGTVVNPFTGEVVPGVEVSDQGPSFTVETA